MLLIKRIVMSVTDEAMIYMPCSVQRHPLTLGGCASNARGIPNVLDSNVTNLSSQYLPKRHASHGKRFPYQLPHTVYTC